MGYLRNILEYFFHNNVSASTADKVKKRLASADNDEEMNAALRNIWDSLAVGDISKNNIETSKAYKRLNSELFGEKRILPLNWIRLAAVWAIPFVMLLTSVYFYSHRDETVALVPQGIEYVQHYVPKGKHECFYLPDSSKVWLNAGSLLVYPATLQADLQRNVYLSGEGFFQVKKDAEHPFVVTTKDLRLEVLGTMFNVSAYPDASESVATLEEGKLKVSIDGLGNHILLPNDQLAYNAQTKSLRRSKVHASDYSDWRNGGLFFNDIPFEEVMTVLERVYHVEIHYRSSVYNHHRIHVHFNKNESVDTIFYVLKLIIPDLEYRIDGTEIYVE